MKSLPPLLSLFVSILSPIQCASASPDPTPPTPADQSLAAYFRSETAAIASHCLTDIKTLNDWTSQREEYRRQLSEMLGLDPMPARTDLKPTITGKLDHPDFTVEKLHFQSRPGLYVTANLYIPKNLTAPAPAILYVCGHSPVKKDGISYGNKTAYQHHGAWFARNGYVCLIPDSLEFGEIDGIHHGLYRLDMWDWLSRGYTPAGVETWNAIRCLDYLQSRPEVDRERIGMTGRSGGGAYTWFTAALDERVKVAVPVAGITDLTNHVVDGTIEGHCDCMFMINTYRWDFPQVAALIAPRPLLISNSDKDTIFPLDGVVRLHSKVRDIYQLYKSEDKLGLLITEGPHNDTQDLQVPAFRWFNRFLKNDKSDLKDALTQNFFQPHELRVFPVHGEPSDSINLQIQESFAPIASPPPVPADAQAWAKMRDEWMQGLRDKTFRGWPSSQLEEFVPISTLIGHLKLRQYFLAQHGDYFNLFIATGRAEQPKSVSVRVLDESELNDLMQTLADAKSRLEADDPKGAAEKMNALMPDANTAMVWIAPRGIDDTPSPANHRRETQIRRRFALIGQTLEGMRIWDVRRALQIIRGVGELRGLPLTLRAKGSMSTIALYASLFEAGITKLELRDLPSTHREGGADLLNVLSVFDMPVALALAAERCKIDLTTSDASPWSYPREVARKLNWPPDQIEINEAKR